jgi:predicted ATPase
VGHGAALALSGYPGEGLVEMQSGARRFLGSGGRLYEPYLWMGMAESHLLLDHVDNCFDCLERSRRCIESRDQKFYEPEMHRLFGAFFRYRGEGGRAEASYARALEVARAQAGRSWELRAATDLARLWRDEGRTAQAHELLRHASAWLPDNVDMPDLRSARAVLDSLG